MSADVERHHDAFLTDLARAALRVYPCEPGASVELINHSENATFQVVEPVSGRRTVLRLHRPGYNTWRRIASELDWLQALRTDAALSTPVPLPATDGALITDLDCPGSQPRFCVRFEYLDGAMPDEDDLVEHAETLGGIAARMHRQSKSWRRPAEFERLVWDYESSLGKRANWGDWRQAPALNPQRMGLLEDLCGALSTRLDAYGRAPDRFGLIHADLRVANLIVRDDGVRVIDFDDCGDGWFLYDLASALSFMEERPDVPDLIERWLAGYARERQLSETDRAEIPTLLMLRRMVILAWIGSHSETDLARALGADYTAGTCQLAEQFLSGDYLRHLREPRPPLP